MKLEINNTTKYKINTRILKKTAEIFGKKMKVNDKEASLALVSSQKIRQLNKTYRGINKVTDVLAFPYIGYRRENFTRSENKKFLGEVIICYNQIVRQAKQQNTSIQNELVFVFIHGLLHLLGYDDKTEKGKREMEKQGIKLCQSIINN